MSNQYRVKPSGQPTSFTADLEHPPKNVIMSPFDPDVPPYFAFTGGDILGGGGTSCTPGSQAQYEFTITYTGTSPGATLELYVNTDGAGYGGAYASGLSVGDFPYTFDAGFYFTGVDGLKTIQAKVVDTAYWASSVQSGEYTLDAALCGA